MMTDEMMKALEADGEKLRQLTGQDHGPFRYPQEEDFDHIEDYDTCPDCSGEGTIEVLAPQHDDPHYSRTERCNSCEGCGWVSHRGLK
jgi:DnaJ-class molecular chaperone